MSLARRALPRSSASPAERTASAAPRSAARLHAVGVSPLPFAPAPPVAALPLTVIEGSPAPADGILAIPGPLPENALKDTLTKAVILATGIAILWFSWDRLSFSRFTVIPKLPEALTWTVIPGVIAAVVVAASYVYRTALWFRYKPVDGTKIADNDLPTVTVVIPAYNEGPMVKKSMMSVMRSNYPKHKLRLVAVDDGSKDDTFTYMKQAAALFPDHMTAMTLGKNQGKRHALYAGFKRATSDVVVTLDSDSVLPPNGLRHLVAPFAHDQDAGAAAGCIKVYNRYQNLLTRMLGVRYLLGFEFTRAYQSVLKSVLCCPGAFAAYRRSVIEPHLDAWLNQTFIGNRCTNGDDHSLTNYVLRSDRAVLYQGNAECFTVVPHTYKRLSKMYTRWARSNIRESLIWFTFATKRAFARREWLAWLDGIVHAVQIPSRLYLLFFTGAVMWTNFDLVVRTLAMATLFSILYAGYFLRSEKSTESIYGMLYAWFALATLQWIYPWAALTVRQNRWMTRG